MMRNDQFAPGNQQPQPPTLFQANQPIDVTLTAQEWNIILAGLHELPYRVAAQVVDNVRMQLSAAAPRAQVQQGALAMTQRE